MKAIFFFFLSIIVNKQDLDPMHAYYNMQLIRSKMNEYMKTSTSILQVGNFSYIPESCNIVVDMTSLNTIESIKTALHIAGPAKSENSIGSMGSSQAQSLNSLQSNIEQANDIVEVKQEEVERWINTPIKDEDITTNPFFTTFKQVD